MDGTDFGGGTQKAGWGVGGGGVNFKGKDQTSMDYGTDVKRC